MSFFRQHIPANVRGGLVSIGNFDGVHRGHRAMLSQLLEMARRKSVPAVVVTFDPHPTTLLSPQSPVRPLTTLTRRTQLLQDLGIDHVAILQVDQDLLGLSAREFFERVIIDELNASGLMEGPNFHFGRRREGDVGLLGQFCRERERTLTVMEPVTTDGVWYSSSGIRSLLADGRLDEAVGWLGAPYQIEGTVVTGAHRGRLLGIPTANLEHIPTVLPAPGVYAGRARVGSGTYRAAINLGPNPTFGESSLKVEVHLLDFHGDLYGQRLQVDLIRRVRATQTFASVNQLKSQLTLDLEQIRREISCVPPDMATTDQERAL